MLLALSNLELTVDCVSPQLSHNLSSHPVRLENANFCAYFVAK